MADRNYFPLGARDRILSAGLELFSRRGFENTTVPQIGKYARVGLNTFYRQFRDKEQLLNEIYRRLRHVLTDVLDVPLRDEDPPREQFHELWMQMVHFDREYPAAIAFLEHRHHGAYLDEESQALERVPEPIINLVERLHRQHAVKNVPAMLLGALVWGAFVEFVKLDSQGRLSLSAERLDAAEGCLWDAVRAPSETSTVGAPETAA